MPDYILNNALFDNAKKTGDNYLVDSFSNVRLIKNLKFLKKILIKNRHVWIIIDEPRFYHAANVPKEISKFIELHFIEYKNSNINFVKIFKWDNK